MNDVSNYRKKSEHLFRKLVDEIQLYHNLLDKYLVRQSIIIKSLKAKNYNTLTKKIKGSSNILEYRKELLNLHSKFVEEYNNSNYTINNRCIEIRNRIFEITKGIVFKDPDFGYNNFIESSKRYINYIEIERNIEQYLGHDISYIHKNRLKLLKNDKDKDYFLQNIRRAKRGKIDIQRRNMLSTEEIIEAYYSITNSYEKVNININSLLSHLLKYIRLYTKINLPKDVEFDDLFQDNAIGAFNAIKRIKDRDTNINSIELLISNLKFIFRDNTRNSRAIRYSSIITSKNRSNCIKVYKCIEEYQKQYEKEPSINIIQEITGLSKRVISRILKNSKSLIEIESNIHNNIAIIDTIESSINIEQDVTNEELRNIINKLLNTLSRREKHIIEHTFGLNGKPILNGNEIAYQYNISRERVRVIKDRALSQLYNYNKRKGMLNEFIR